MCLRASNCAYATDLLLGEKEIVVLFLQINKAYEQLEEASLATTWSNYVSSFRKEGPETVDLDLTIIVLVELL